MEIVELDIQSECDEQLPDLTVEPKVDNDMMDISLKNNDDNAVDTSLDYEFDDIPLDYGSTTTFRPVSAKKTGTASGPSISGVTSRTYKPRRTKGKKIYFRNWRTDWESDFQPDLSESPSE